MICLLQFVLLEIQFHVLQRISDLLFVILHLIIRYLLPNKEVNLKGYLCSYYKPIGYGIKQIRNIPSSFPLSKFSFATFPLISNLWLGVFLGAGGGGIVGREPPGLS
jgi:hypothetical protein